MRLVVARQEFDDRLLGLARVIALSLFLAALTNSVRAENAPELSAGQTLYVPVYSHIWHGNLNGAGKPYRLLLSAMLSLRNTDPARGITITSARYYDTAGKLLREHLVRPLELGPLQSSDLFVEHQDSAGGTGANFLVVWHAAEPVNPPIVEAVHAYFVGTQSVAFTSAGRPISVPAQ